MDLLTEMRIPTRAAPKPPISNAATPAPPKRGSNNNIWGNSNDLLSSTLQVPQKKKPPPRPPPPKFPPNYLSYGAEKPKKLARPTELLSNLFGRTKNKQTQQQQQSSTNGPSHFNSRSSLTSSSNSACGSSTNLTFSSTKMNNDGNTSFSLIDLSPPGSPTFTTRSSSDGVSVDSFGSDGNSNPSAFTTSSGSTSQTESAFEDDFDFFGNRPTGGKKQSDPWRVTCSKDPFDTLEQSSSKSILQQWPPTTSQQQTTVPIKEIGESNFFVFNDAPPTRSSSASGSPFDSPSRQFHMPTIIRPKKTKSDASSNDKVLKSNIYQSSASSNNYAAAPRFTPTASLIEEKSSWNDEDDDESLALSPPMPKLPPPPPPPEYIAGLEDGLMVKAYPTRPPYGIALYDFPASQPGDLDLKEGDVIQLTKLINDNWIEGRVGDREGMFPINFVDVKIPLPGLETNVVNALFTFKAETSGDLSFEEGARIKVLSRISADWLYGEYQGKKGQFPANFIDKVPNDLPNHL